MGTELWPSHLVPLIQDAAGNLSNYAFELNRPFNIMRPKIYIDGDEWCCLYGENLQDGVCGFGRSPHKASVDFDNAWYKDLPTEKTEES